MFAIPFIQVGTKPQRKPQAQAPIIPQSTLYVRNLNEEESIADMQKALTEIFSSQSPVIDIKIKKNIKHRGQAFISFATVNSATDAKNALNGYMLFEKPMDVQYAREPAFAVSKISGNLEKHKADRDAKRLADSEFAVASKKQKRTTIEDHLPPNAILFVQNLPLGTAEATIITMFSQFPGFKEVRSVPGKSDLAFVEYESEVSAGVAKQSLNGYRITPTVELKVSYARK